jgi:hypothetical protein
MKLSKGAPGDLVRSDYSLFTVTLTSSEKQISLSRSDNTLSLIALEVTQVIEDGPDCKGSHPRHRQTQGQRIVRH